MLLPRSSPRTSRCTRDTRLATKHAPPPPGEAPPPPTRQAQSQAHGRLPGGVTGSDDNDRAVTTQQRFLIGSGVIHTVAVECIDPRDAKAAITCSGGQHRGAADGHSVVRENDLELSTVGFQPDSLRGHRNPRAELIGLQECPFGKVRSGDSGRETQVVLNARRRPGLAANGYSLYRCSPQAVRSAVHRSAQTGRTGAHHDQVAFVADYVR